METFEIEDLTSSKVDDVYGLLNFEEFKMSRLRRECVITEKIDGTNGRIVIEYYTEHDKYLFLVGSKTKYITPKNDNAGFARWCYEHKEELIKNLGMGTHRGEWWGQGIQRKYGLKEKRFSLFNTFRWLPKGAIIQYPDKQSHVPDCCHVVPVLYCGIFNTNKVTECIENLKQNGSIAAPGFMSPEGVVIYHTASKQYYKQTIEKDEMPKSMVI